MVQALFHMPRTCFGMMLAHVQTCGVAACGRLDTCPFHARRCWQLAACLQLAQLPGAAVSRHRLLTPPTCPPLCCSAVARDGRDNAARPGKLATAGRPVVGLAVQCKDVHAPLLAARHYFKLRGVAVSASWGRAGQSNSGINEMLFPSKDKAREMLSPSLSPPLQVAELEARCLQKLRGRLGP